MVESAIGTVEPLARGNRRAGALIRRFKEAQDLLGEHHDMHLFSSGIASFREGVSASKFPGLEPGLATLARLADEAAMSAFDRFHAVWGGESGERILSRVEELGRALEAPPSPSTPVGERHSVESPPEPPAVDVGPPSEEQLVSPVSIPERMGVQ